MVTAKEMADALGISRSNLSYYCAAKKLPYLKIEKFVYFKADEARAAYEALDRTKGRRRN
jgi:DNA-binding transcriptional regulator GbsR (MarR family)